MVATAGKRVRVWLENWITLGMREKGRRGERAGHTHISKLASMIAIESRIPRRKPSKRRGKKESYF